MALIQISKLKNWFTNRWIFNNLLEKLLIKVSDSNELHNKLNASFKDGSYYIDLSKYSRDEKQIIISKLDDILTEMKSEGDAAFHSIEFYEGFYAKIIELIELLKVE